MNSGKYLALVAATVAGCLMGAAGTASAAGNYTLVTEPADQYQTIHSFISSATRTLDMTMYELTDTIAENDLAADAARGVAVRVILDQNREKSANQAAYTFLAAHGVQVRWASTTYEATHQKTITVDGGVSAVMSGNLTSQYYSTSRDFDVIDRDTADVAAIAKVFAADFASAAITPGAGDDLVWSPTTAQDALLKVIDSANSSLSVENEEMDSSVITNALIAAAKRGVRVEVTMTNSTGWTTAFTELSAAGAYISTYASTASLYIHAKAIVADAGEPAAAVYVGSINFSSASMDHNRELGLVLTDAGVLGSVAATLDADFAGGTPFNGISPPAAR